MENNTMSQIEVVSLSAQLPIDIKPIVGRKWVLNGENNSNFIMYKDAYDDSPTNSAIINAYANYTYADGLINTAIEDVKNSKASVNKHISKKDVRLLVNDYKTYGGYTVQVIWNAAEKNEDKRPLLIKHLPIPSIGLNLEKDTMEVDGYWYSFDWSNTSKYKPEFYPKYDGTYKGYDVEIHYVQRASSNPFFSQPDYVSGLRYAQIEGELSNSAFNHILNGFQGAKVVNVNGGVPPTEELKEMYTKKILSKLTGTTNTNKVIVSFNVDKDKAIEVTDIPVTELNQQYVQFALEAENKLIVAHSAPPILFSGTREASGFSSNADEIEVATKGLFRKQIYPMREDILDGLMEVFKDIDSSVQLDFLDFEDFNINDKKEE